MRVLVSSRFLIVALVVVMLTGGLFSQQVTYAQDGESTYTVAVVGGKDESQTYADQEVDGFQFTDMTYRSLYPSGMEFKATIVPPEGMQIEQVTLFYTFSTGKLGRIRAERGDAPNEWIAVPYGARGLPPWHEIDAYWGVRGANDLSVDSEPVHAVYYDPTREWYRAESEDIVVYWFGMPEELGKYTIDAMAENRDKYHQGFGMEIPFRPLSVVFPPGGVWNEYKGDDTVDDTEFGSTGTIISEAGSTIQRVRTLEPAAIRAECIWNEANPTVEFQMKQAASTTTHEVAHLYQQERGVSGPAWWVEGQATFFENWMEYDVHARLRKLAELRGGELPTLQGDGPSGGPYTVAEDGCTHLMYDMGASFMLWLTDTHGGIDTYRTVVDEMAQAHTLFEALETTTGFTALELENEWRAFLGVGPVPPEVLDPALALDPPAEPFFAVGEQVVMPASPFQQSMYTKPTEQSISNAACFANSTATVLQAGNDGTVNWYEMECMGMVGWMSQAQLVGP